MFITNYILVFSMILKRNQDNSVGIATVYDLDCWGSLPGRVKIFSSQSVKTCCGAHPVSHPVGTGVCFSRVKRLGRETDHSHLSSAEVKNGGDIPSLPHMSHIVVLN